MWDGYTAFHLNAVLSFGKIHEPKRKWELPSPCLSHTFLFYFIFAAFPFLYDSLHQIHWKLHNLQISGALKFTLVVAVQ